MSMDREEMKKILEKAAGLEKGKAIALAKEFIHLDDRITEVQDALGALAASPDEEITVELEIT